MTDNQRELIKYYYTYRTNQIFYHFLVCVSASLSTAPKKQPQKGTTSKKAALPWDAERSRSIAHPALWNTHTASRALVHSPLGVTICMKICVVNRIAISTDNPSYQSTAGNATRAGPTKKRAGPGVNSRLIEKTTKG